MKTEIKAKIENMKNQDIINNINAQIKLLEDRGSITNAEHDKYDVCIKDSQGLYNTNIKYITNDEPIDYLSAINNLKKAIKCLAVCGLGKTTDECDYHNNHCTSKCTDICKYKKVSWAEALELF